MKTKPSKAEHKRDRLPQIKKGEGAPIHIVLPYGPLADAVEDIGLSHTHNSSKPLNYAAKEHL